MAGPKKRSVDSFVYFGKARLTDFCQSIRAYTPFESFVRKLNQEMGILDPMDSTALMIEGLTAGKLQNRTVDLCTWTYREFFRVNNEDKNPTSIEDFFKNILQPIGALLRIYCRVAMCDYLNIICMKSADLWTPRYPSLRAENPRKVVDCLAGEDNKLRLFVEEHEDEFERLYNDCDSVKMRFALSRMSTDMRSRILECDRLADMKKALPQDHQLCLKGIIRGSHRHSRNFSHVLSRLRESGLQEWDAEFKALSDIGYLRCRDEKPVGSFSPLFDYYLLQTEKRTSVSWQVVRYGIFSLLLLGYGYVSVQIGRFVVSSAPTLALLGELLIGMATTALAIALVVRLIIGTIDPRHSILELLAAVLPDFAIKWLDGLFRFPKDD